MNDNYELLESFEKEKGSWAYLRHKKNGLQIAYHKCNTENPGFSFCFNTPVEDQYLGTTHVLEHCVLTGSQKYDLSFLRLLELACYSNFNATTDQYSTRYFFYSSFEEECFKMIPILADYLFFPQLSEEAFMQECVRVEFDEKGDGRKKELAGVIYNELKASNDDETFSGGTYYLLQKLTVKRIREYHKKYYRPDNCLFIFHGNASLEEVLKKLDDFIEENKNGFDYSTITPRKNLTVKEFLEKVPYEQAPEKPEDPIIIHWQIGKGEDICYQIEEYWGDGLSPIMPFVLEEKYAYSAYCWWKEHFKDYEDELIPKKIPVPKIISEYLSRFSLSEYKKKLGQLHKWQARDVREQARKIMEPLIVQQYDMELPGKKEELEKRKNSKWERIERSWKKHLDMKKNIAKNSCSISFQSSELYTPAYYAEYALFVFLQMFLHTRLRQLGKTYDVSFNFNTAGTFVIFTLNNNKPEQTLKLITKLIKETENYSFTEYDLLSIKSRIYCLIMQESIWLNFSEEIFKVTTDDLHQAAIRISHIIEPPKKDETYYYSIGAVVK